MKKITVTCLGVLVILFSVGGYAQIRTDASLGQAARTLAGPNFLIPQTYGKLSGNNLFHSFESFTILSGQSAHFTTDTAGIGNVISRVTGGSLSQINGKLQLTPVSGTPGFFFINTAGVTFGAGASIDVPGAFHVSTANYLKFANGNFYADTAKASTFSSAAPQAFGFLKTTRAKISLQDGASLTTRTSHPMSVVGSDIEINNSSISSTQGGDVRVIAFGQTPGDVELTGSLLPAYGDINIVNGVIGSYAEGEGHAGRVAVSTGNLSVNAKDVAQGGDMGVVSIARTDASGSAGPVEVMATGVVTLVNGGEIGSVNYSQGDAGAVTVNAKIIRMDRMGNPNSISGIVSQVAGSGNAGNIDVTAIETLAVLQGGEISSNTYSSGHAGSVNIHAATITLDGQQEKSFLTRIGSAAVSGTGNAGNVNVTASDTLEMQAGGEISSVTYSSGNGGSIKVHAGMISIDGQGSSITSDAREGSTGKAGDVDVFSSGALVVLQGGLMTSNTYSSGHAGSVHINAATVTVDGRGDWAGIGSLAAPGAGNAGSINMVVSGALNILNGGFVSSSTYSGNAGSVKVNAGVITIDGQGSFNTGIFTDADSGSTGTAGDIEIMTHDALDILNGGQISSSTYSTGKAGSIEVTASGALTLLKDGIILSSTFSKGDAGSVKVNAKTMTIDGQYVDNGASVGSSSDPGSTGNAGTVDVTVSDELKVLNGAAIGASTYGTGNAGSVTVHAKTLLVDGSGNQSGSDIRARAGEGSSGQPGSVSVTASESVTLSNGGKLSITNLATVANPERIVPTTLTVTAPIMTLKDASITSASTGNGAASNVCIYFIDTLSLDPSSITTSANLGNGGSISIQGGKVMTMDNSYITTSVKGLTGNGGNINISASTLLMNTGFIQANTAAPDAKGGMVDMNVQMLVPIGGSLFVGGQTPYTFQPGVFGFNVIQAAAPTGVSGTVQMTSPALDISGSLNGLSTQVIDAGGLWRSPCHITGGSSLVQSGRGGLAPSALGLLRTEPVVVPVKSGATTSVMVDQSLAFNLWNCN